MNPSIALQIAHDHHARLRRERTWHLPAAHRASGRSAGGDARRPRQVRRARQAAGWALVEIGLKLALRNVLGPSELSRPSAS